MAHIGNNPSMAHEYASNDVCLHCGMYKTNVEILNHVCTPAREELFKDKMAEVIKAKLEGRQNG